MVPFPWILRFLWFIPLFPLLAAGLIALLKQKDRKLAADSAIAAMGLSLVLAVTALGELLLAPQRLYVNFPWLQYGSEWLKLGWVMDPLAAVMLVMVTFVGLLIFIYSAAYMHEDQNFTRFFCFLSLFAGAMLGLLIANSLLLLFMCWEVVGLTSYLLIGFWYQRPAAAAAAKKAFLTTRIGDLGLLAGMVWLQGQVGTLVFYDHGAGCLEQGPLSHLAAKTLTGIALLIFCGAVGKSGQLPLHVWLPDAMEGPTPVSALIHAATMVAAGVYLMARVYPLVGASADALKVIAWVGALTAIFAAMIAVAQDDIKRILAYSTISQLGYMFLACGAAAYSAAIFHLVTHAFFKALLFLAAGSVIHAVGGEQDMRVMGGLRRYIPVTFWTMTMAVFAISGFPPFAGFFSKDEILAEVFRSPNGGPLLWAVALVTVAITSFYMFRLWYMTFFGQLRLQPEAPPHEASRVALGDDLLPEHSTNGHHAQAQPHAQGIHESPKSMLIPLVLLAVLSVTGGWIGIPHSLGGSDRFGRFLDPVTHGTGVPASFEQVSIAMRTGAPIPTTEPTSKPEDPKTERMLTGCSVFAALLGWLLADTLYRRKPYLPAKMAAGSRALYGLVFNKYWVDEIYGFLIVKPVLIVSRYILWGGFDRGVIGGGGRVLASGTQGVGAVLRRIQSGNIRSYAGWLALGAAAILLLSFFGFGAHLHMGVAR
jgi:NADH-quinone oxidoreductase subunit L